LIYICVFQSEDFLAEMETRLRNCSRWIQQSRYLYNKLFIYSLFD